MERGRIIKGISGFYEVLLTNQTVVTCKARGRFRKQHLTPMVGDYVEVQPQNDGFWAVQNFLPRKNALLRPPVSNIDQLAIVIAASAPKPDWLLVDKLILQSMLLKVSPLLILNKLDEQDPGIVQMFQADYTSAFTTIQVSVRTGLGLDTLKSNLSGKISCFAGQSAVGKSSLLNMLMPELALTTGELTRKTDRGRHTTRHAELWPYCGGAVLDTPGFSQFDTIDISQEDLNGCYPEFGIEPGHCRFAGCTHISEPDCAVKQLLQSGKLSGGRYARYIELENEIQQRRKHQYD
ncbi:MAG: ribosome small subunit-dependent GTPase A [Clostridia bacterium]